MLAWAMPSVSRLTIGQFFIQSSQRSENNSTFHIRHSTIGYADHSTFLIPHSSFEEMLFLLQIILHLDDEDDDAAGKGDEVGEYQVVVLNQQSLNYKRKATYSHHDEARQRDAVGVTCTNSLNGLGQITQNKSDAGYPAAKVNQKIVVHSFLVILFLISACEFTAFYSKNQTFCQKTALICTISIIYLQFFWCFLS
jgi:hypothetical protein